MSRFGPRVVHLLCHTRGDRNCTPNQQAACGERYRSLQELQRDAGL